jgi:hypothetical protein
MEGEKSTVSVILAINSHEMLWETQTETWDSETRKECFIAVDLCPKAEPQEERCLILCRLASRLQRQ